MSLNLALWSWPGGSAVDQLGAQRKGAYNRHLLVVCYPTSIYLLYHVLLYSILSFIS
ncbi:hypothetical protein BT63DRAFT_319637 [Microthyrium microscopicum]|uniref:Uncharacterized protein n=1 Tax=Microthyrium microscopicum TaxID=703497 RepID=A0A6A6U596_9PEZI|nr:hypothetical protein BT63DRAFT_319637 [Microthyrium microscopicum]